MNLISRHYKGIYNEKPRIIRHFIDNNSLASLKILHISDIHGNWHILQKVTEMIDARDFKYHLLLVTGDLVNRKSQLKKVCDILQYLVKKASLFCGFVPGNNEKYRKYRDFFPKIALELHRIGIDMLSNRVIDLRYNNNPLILCGIDDLMEGRPDILNIMSKSRFTHQRSILLCHVPSICFSSIFSSFFLVLSGHTHGGQIALPFTGPLYLNANVLPLKYSRGMHRLNSTYLNISGGLGTSSIHFRFNAPPEVSLIEMKRAT